MKQILLLALILFSIFKVNGQSPCATDEYDAYLKRTNPQYATERAKMEQQIYSILKNKQNNPQNKTDILNIKNAIQNNIDNTFLSLLKSLL